MKNVILIGMPGCGKTTFGRRAAQALGVPFADADEVIEAMEGRTIPELFSEGEDVFRAAEIRASAALAQREGTIIAAGGGVVKRRDNLALLGATGKILFIDRAPEDIAADVAIAGRPLLAAGPERVYDLYQERIAAYRAAADQTVENRGNAAEVLQKVIEAVRQLMGGRA